MTSLAGLAASYAFGLSRNHPFVDGNKRTSLVVAELFLALNGLQLDASDAECVTTFLALAAGELSEKELAAWIGVQVTESLLVAFTSISLGILCVFP